MSTITVATHNFENWTYGGASATLRIFALQQFITSDGDTIAQGDVQTPANYKSVSCGVSGTMVTIPEFTLDSTTDSNTPSAQYIAYLYDVNGVRRDLFPPSAFALPHNLTSTSWTNIVAYNRTIPSTRLARNVYTADQIDVMLQNIVVDYDDVTATPEHIVRNLTELNAVIGLANASPSAQMSATMSADITVSTAVTIPANLIIRRSNGAKFIQASTGTLTFAGIGIEDAESTVPMFYDFAVGEVEWSGTAWPPRISTELFDTNTVSLTTRVAIADAALEGKAATIICYPRTITDSVTITEHHALVFTEGEYQNSLNTWGGSYQAAFLLQDNTRVTGTPGAIIYESPNDGNTKLFQAYHMRYGGGDTELFNENITVEYLHLVGSEDQVDISGSNPTIQLGNCINGVVRHCVFDRMHGYCITLGAYGASGNYARNCDVYGNLLIGCGSQIVALINCLNCRVFDNRFDQTLTNNSATYTVLDVEPNVEGDRCEHLEIFNNIFDFSGEISDGSKYGIGISLNAALRGSIKFVSVRNNTFLGREAWPTPTDTNPQIVSIMAVGVLELDIADNYLRANVQRAMIISKCRQVHIRNNIGFMNTDTVGDNAAITLIGVADAVVSGNSLTEDGLFASRQSAAISESERDYTVTASGTTITSVLSLVHNLFYDFFKGLTCVLNATTYTFSTLTTWTTMTVTTTIGTLPQVTFASATDVNTGTDVITVTGHPYNTGAKVYYSAGTAAVGGLTTATAYYVISASANTIKLATTLANALAGTAINLTSTGTGTQTLTFIMETRFSNNLYVNNSTPDGLTLASTGTSQIANTARDGVITSVADAAHTASVAAGVIVYTSLTAPRTVTLPTATTCRGKEIVIKDGAGAAATHNITIDGNGSETIDGSSTLVISTNYASKRVKSDGVNWFTVS